jgi:sigma-E factor negative regulatory protein RseB
MFSRATQERGGAPLDQDPLHLRIASAAVVLGLVATGFVMVSRDAARGGSAALTGAAAGRPAAAGRSGPMTAGRPAQARSAGLRLLSEAAAACQNVAYQGVQVIASLNPGGRNVSVVDVWHERGRQALIQAAAIAAQPGLRRGVAQMAGDSYSANDTGDEQDPAPILGMTPQMVTLLGANYQVTIAGGGLADGRPAQVVVVRRADGGLAARFWLDNATKLPLRRQVFDIHARAISDDSFIALTLGAQAAAGAPAAGARPPSSPLSGGQLSRLRAQGWPLPGPLPGRLTQFEANRTVTASGTVIELAYSDGLSVVSLFVQRGQLPAELSGWSEVALRGQRVYAADPDDRSVAWSAGGFVYTVIADAPGQTVDQVVATLPHNASPGLVARLIRGLRRLISWLDPFR